MHLNLDRTSSHLDNLYEAFEEGGARTHGSSWNLCVRQLAAVQETWLKEGWISSGDFKPALVVLAHQAGKSVAPSATTASLLLMLTTPIEGRQQRSVWARALQEVLDGHLDVSRAAEMGVTGVLAAIRTRVSAEAKQAARRRKELKSYKNVIGKARPFQLTIRRRGPDRD